VTISFIAVAISGITFLLVVVAGRPKVVLGVAFLALFSARTLAQATKVSALGYVDEIVVGLLFAWLVLIPFAMGKRIRSFPGLVWFALFAVLGLAGAHVAGVSFPWAVGSAYLALKGVLFGWSVAQLDWTARDLRPIARLGCGITLVVLAAGVINMIIPDAWTAVLDNDGVADYRGSVPSAIGPFVHPGEFAVITALGSIAVAAWIATHRATHRNVALLVATLIGCALSFRRKSAVGVLAALTWVGMKTNKPRAVLILALTTPVILAGSWATLGNVLAYTQREYLARPDENARIVLTKGAFDVANDHFPLGAGFGRYGSYLAQVDYSPEYYSRRFDVVWGLGTDEDSGSALTDTMWPAILGEGGYLGAAAFAIGLVMIYRSAGRVRSTSEADVRWLGLVVGAWSIELAFESIALAAYSAPPVFPLLVGAAGILQAIHAGEIEATPRERAPAVRGAAPPSGERSDSREDRNR
jgi:hypothetical protein